MLYVRTYRCPTQVTSYGMWHQCFSRRCWAILQAAVKSCVHPTYVTSHSAPPSLLPFVRDGCGVVGVVRISVSHTLVLLVLSITCQCIARLIHHIFSLYVHLRLFLTRSLLAGQPLPTDSSVLINYSTQEIYFVLRLYCSMAACFGHPCVS